MAGSMDDVAVVVGVVVHMACSDSVVVSVGLVVSRTDIVAGMGSCVGTGIGIGSGIVGVGVGGSGFSSAFCFGVAVLFVFFVPVDMAHTHVAGTNTPRCPKKLQWDTHNAAGRGARPSWYAQMEGGAIAMQKGG